jgi:dTMP kinase
VKQGRFIALEGGEGVGKSTQGRKLAEALRALGFEVVTTREPGGTPGAEAIRTMLLSTEGDGWGARAEALLFAAARADHVERLIRPAIARGAWVVCDRFVDSSRAYQGGGGGLSDADILDLHRIGSESLLPDLTILLSVRPEVSAERLALRDGGAGDRIESRGAAYHARVAEAFRNFAARDPARFALIDAEGSPDDVHARVMASLAGLLP